MSHINAASVSGCEFFFLFLEMADLAKEGVCRADSPGILGSSDPKVDPAHTLSGRGSGRSQVTKALGTFREHFEKFVYWNFLSVEILRFAAALPLLPGLGSNLFSREDFLTGSGGGGGQDS